MPLVPVTHCGVEMNVRGDFFFFFLKQVTSGPVSPKIKAASVGAQHLPGERPAAA